MMRVCAQNHAKFALHSPCRDITVRIRVDIGIDAHADARSFLRVVATSLIRYQFCRDSTLKKGPRIWMASVYFSAVFCRHCITIFSGLL